MKELVVNKQGRVAVVDDEDFPTLSKYQWRHRKGHHVYRIEMQKGRQLRRYLQDEVMKPEFGYKVWFKDFNFLNCQRSNLVIHFDPYASWAAPPKPCRNAKFIGVYPAIEVGKFQALFGEYPDHKFLGHFNTEEEAARAYDQTALKLLGPEAAFNFPEDAIAAYNRETGENREIKLFPDVPTSYQFNYHGASKKARHKVRRKKKLDKADEP